MNEHSAAKHRSVMFAGLRVVSACTLLSRILGMVRDIGMAFLFGNGPVMDAFSIAFRLPNLARRLFGEGALTSAFLPAFIKTREQLGIHAGWKLASALCALLACILSAGVIVLEILLWFLLQAETFGTETELLLQLIAIMLPYTIFICVAAQLSAILHALNHFVIPALLPVVLNSIWIMVIGLVAVRFDDQSAQAVTIATSIMLTGLLQIVATFPQLRSLGFQFILTWRSVWQDVRGIVYAMLPIVLVLSISQFNVLSDSLIAWFFSQPEQITADQAASTFLFNLPRYPFESGTASALYFGQRMYQFPLGIFGVALGTVLFPLLTRHAQRGEHAEFRNDLTLGIRLIFVIGLPASAGLFLLARPITNLLFVHGEFDLDDATQTAEMIRAYGSAVWAYSGLLILQRGFYALEDRLTPLRVGMVAVVLNLALNFLLMWPLGGGGLAWATAISAIVQMGGTLYLLARRGAPLNWREAVGTLLKSILATTVMGMACWLVLISLETSSMSFTTRFFAVVLPVLVSVLVYFAAAWLLQMSEIKFLLNRKP